jgi:hypothetical protein
LGKGPGSGFMQKAGKSSAKHLDLYAQVCLDSVRPTAQIWIQKKAWIWIQQYCKPGFGKA